MAPVGSVFAPKIGTTTSGVSHKSITPAPLSSVMLVTEGIAAASVSAPTPENGHSTTGAKPYSAIAQSVTIDSSGALHWGSETGVSPVLSSVPGGELVDSSVVMPSSPNDVSSFSGNARTEQARERERETTMRRGIG